MDYTLREDESGEEFSGSFRISDADTINETFNSNSDSDVDTKVGATYVNHAGRAKLHRHSRISIASDDDLLVSEVVADTSSSSSGVRRIHNLRHKNVLSLDPDEDTSENELTGRNNFNLKKNNQRTACGKFYSSTEDVVIAKYIYEHKKRDSVNGISLWKKLERSGIVQGHSWQSMRERYNKRIINRLEALLEKGLLPINVVFYLRPIINDEPEQMQKQINRVTQQLKRPQVRKDKVAQMYTHEEDQLIVYYIIKRKLYSKVNSKSLYVSMTEQQNGLKHRTWESLRSRFTKHISKRIESFNLCPNITNMFKKDFNGELCEMEGNDRNIFVSKRTQRFSPEREAATIHTKFLPQATTGITSTQKVEIKQRSHQAHINDEKLFKTTAVVPSCSKTKILHKFNPEQKELLTLPPLLNNNNEVLINQQSEQPDNSTLVVNLTNANELTMVEKPIVNDTPEATKIRFSCKTSEKKKKIKSDESLEENSLTNSSSVQNNTIMLSPLKYVANSKSLIMSLPCKSKLTSTPLRNKEAHQTTLNNSPSKQNRSKLVHFDFNSPNRLKLDNPMISSRKNLFILAELQQKKKTLRHNLKEQEKMFPQKPLLVPKKRVNQELSTKPQTGIRFWHLNEQHGNDCTFIKSINI